MNLVNTPIRNMNETFGGRKFTVDKRETRAQADRLRVVVVMLVWTRLGLRKRSGVPHTSKQKEHTKPRIIRFR